MKVTALAHQIDGWWVVEVVEVSALSPRARRLDQIEAVVRNAVALEPAKVEVELVPALDEQAEAALNQVRAVRADPNASRGNEGAALRFAAGVLETQGRPTKDIAVVLGVSLQQARELLESAEIVARGMRQVIRRGDAGKAEAMALMKEQKAALAEERAARLKAAKSGLHVEPPTNGTNPPS